MSLITGLVSYWKLDEESGEVAEDSHGLNNGAYEGNLPDPVAGIINYAQDFDGDDDYIILPANDDLKLTNEFSISLWINLDTIQNSFFVGIWGTGDSNQAYYFGLNHDGTLVLHTQSDGAQGGAYSDTPLTAVGGWYHCVVTFKNGTIKFYLNGSPDGGDSGNPVPHTTPQTGRIGISADKNDADLDGQIDEIGIWNKELTLSEAQALFNSGAGLPYPFAKARSHGYIFG